MSTTARSHTAATRVAGPMSTELPVTNLRRQPRRRPIVRHPSPHGNGRPGSSASEPLGFLA